MQYDLVVIGGGPGGYTGAIRAAKLGLKTALVEQRDLGGTCLNRGCIPTKALLHSAELYSSRSEWAECGILAENVALDQSKIYERKQKIVSTLRTGVEGLVKANGIDLFVGKGEITAKNNVKIGETTITAKNILLATGSSPAPFNPKRPLYGMENTLSSDDVLSAPIEDDKIVIIGGGVIATEFASYFVNIGKSVTMVVSGERILGSLSKDISTQLGMVLKRKGLKIVANAQIKQLYKDKAVLVAESGEVEVEGRVITAVGRVSNLDGLGLDNIGLSYDKFIKTDSNMMTAADGVYACGDITGGFQLAHYAAASAIVAVEHMAGQKPSIDLTVCPACIYTQPEIAVVGTSQQPEDGKSGKFVMGGNGKSVIEGLNRGFIRIVTDKDDTVIGGELFCARATDIVGEVALMVQKRMNVHQASQVIRPHPTVMEAVGETLEDIYGLATHALPRKA